MISFDDHLEELVQTVVAARLNYDIWWIYKHDRPKYVDVLNEYVEFFRVGIHAHFVAMLMALYKLGDPRKDSMSVRTLITEAKKITCFSNSVITTAESKLQKIDSIWQKVRTLRHKLFAHRDINLNYDRSGRVCLDSRNRFISDKLPVHATTCF